VRGRAGLFDLRGDSCGGGVGWDLDSVGYCGYGCGGDAAAVAAGITASDLVGGPVAVRAVWVGAKTLAAGRYGVLLVGRGGVRRFAFDSFDERGRWRVGDAYSEWNIQSGCFGERRWVGAQCGFDPAGAVGARFKVRRGVGLLCDIMRIGRRLPRRPMPIGSCSLPASR